MPGAAPSPARHYDPETANFLSQDTYRGEIEDCDQWNLYAYCANDPVDHVDRKGNKRVTIAYDGKHSLLRNAQHSCYYPDGGSSIRKVVYGQDFVREWNNLDKADKEVYLYVHGDESQLTFKDYSDLSLSDLKSLKRKKKIKKLFLLSCKGAAGGKKKSVAYNLYKKTGKRTKVYASRHSVSFRLVDTRIRTYYVPRYDKKYIEKHGIIYYYKNPVKRMRWSK